MIGSIFSEDKEKYFGYIEGSIGLGLVIGPPLGSIMYGNLGYEWAFFSTSIISLLAALACFITLSPKLNVDPESKASKRKNLIKSH